MSSLETAIKGLAVTAAVAVAATAYVVVHERRRKSKKDKKAAAAGAEGSSGPSVLAMDKLIELLTESANAAYQLIEQVRAALPPPRAPSPWSLAAAASQRAAPAALRPASCG